MAVNSEAIYATRPWKIFGSGPGADIKPSVAAQFNEATRHMVNAFLRRARNIYGAPLPAVPASAQMGSQGV